MDVAGSSSFVSNEAIEDVFHVSFAVDVTYDITCVFIDISSCYLFSACICTVQNLRFICAAAGLSLANERILEQHAVLYGYALVVNSDQSYSMYFRWPSDVCYD